MKKIIALALAILMMAAIAVPAMAEDAVPAVDKTFDNEANTGSSLVELGVSVGYTVTIPVTIKFDADLTGEATITASSVMIAGNEELQITIDSTQYGSNNSSCWVLNEKDGKSAPVDYYIYNGVVDETNKVDAEDVILVVDADADDAEYTTPDDVTTGYTKSVTLNLTTEGTSQVGTYQDTLTFSAAVVGPQQNG